MAKVRVVDVTATHKGDDWEAPFWIAEMDYSGMRVNIPLPAHNLAGRPDRHRILEAIEGMENLARALLDHATRMRKDIHDAPDPPHQ